MNVKEVTQLQHSKLVVGTPKDQLDFMVVRISDDWPDPQQYLFNQMASSQAVVGSLNTASYSNPQVDDLFKQASATSDPQRRAAILAQVLKFQDEDLPYIPFWEQDIISASSDKVTWDGFNTWYNQTAWLTSLR
jgi:ABC-type transport system substrate-binding protein